MRGDEYEDAAIVRHLHDLAVLKAVALKSDIFPELVLLSMSHDDRRSKNNPDFAGLAVAAKFKQMFDVLENDDEYQREYDQFVKGVSYAPEENIPSYEQALDAVRALADAVTT